ncbi:MAG: TIGR04255 family protein [Deltaproteobacteria bacterium HGW-Deltaproteobacteria-14]|jgi:uncharacterized protein (TIGR04255 family)|nr:MAG: TIGR04255 family protein [Deltaproteobacteria bacterium HGW-Deltaproteobacteria-14]
MNVDFDPFVASPPSEIPLRDAPLVRVIAQVRFPEILSLGQRDFVAPFQEALRSTYPVLREEQAHGFRLEPAGLVPATPLTAWRFADVDGSWRVSLTPAFVALETTRYTSRTDFFERLGVVLEALAEHVGPKQADRLGVRYIDRITGASVGDIAGLVRAEVLGITGTLAATHAAFALSESVFELPDAQLVARWGVLPPGATVDPAAIEPASEQSWILDLDMFSASPMPFSPEHLIAEGRRFAERIYTVFRWAVTDEFLARYGATP